MAGARWSSTWPASTTCASPTRADAPGQRRRRGHGDSAPPPRAGVRASSTRPRRRRSARRPAPSAARTPRTAAGTCPTTSAPRPRASARRSRPAASPGVEVVCVNPSSVQGPGRAGGTARFLLAFLDGRLKAFVQTNVSLVDIADCAEGHMLAARARGGRRALPAQRDPDAAQRCADARRRRGRRERRPRAGPAPRRRSRARSWSSTRFGWPASARRCAARWSGRCCTATATTARGRSASSASLHARRATRCGAPFEWARANGLLRL